MIRRYEVLLIQTSIFATRDSHSSFVAQIGFINYPNYPTESNLAVPHPILGAILAHSGENKPSAPGLRNTNTRGKRLRACVRACLWEEGTSQTLHSSFFNPSTCNNNPLSFYPRECHDRHHTASTAPRLIIDTLYARYNFYS